MDNSNWSGMVGVPVRPPAKYYLRMTGDVYMLLDGCCYLNRVKRKQGLVFEINDQFQKDGYQTYFTDDEIKLYDLQTLIDDNVFEKIKVEDRELWI